MTDAEIAIAYQLSGVKQEMYEWQLLDAQYEKITTHLLGKINALWTSQWNLPANRRFTEADIEAAVGLLGNRFFPTIEYAPNPVNYTLLAPLKLPILFGYNLADSAPLPPPGQAGFNNAIYQVGSVLYSWLCLRIHKSSGALARYQLCLRGLEASQDSQELSQFLSNAIQ